ncbi:hypothetical protein PHMEG_00016384 [Phytophthora megakarya]|uniref:Uncharacterized protein n=1 Tax=Phytophthora megakarya TaxID=4795 RepID=A0A225W1K4_9STRA|nr:hypothetical protein PHMEG_00016384 [Phytophthora megakarya]
MNVLLKRRPGNCDFSKPSGWRIVVTQHRAVHNHPLNEESFLVHPRNRKVENPMVLEAVSALRKAGVTQGVIRNYISEKEPSKNVTRSDVNNLLAKLKSNNFVVPPPSTTSSSAPQVTSSTTELNGGIEIEQPLDQPSTPERGGADDAENTLEHDSIMEEDDGTPAERPPEDQALGFSGDDSGGSRGNDGTPAECPREDQALGFSGDGGGEGRVTQHDTTKPSSQGFHVITTANFRLRVRDRQNNRVSGDNQDTRDHNWTIHTNSGQGLCDHGIVNTDSSQDRTSRLEGRNVALCAQNAKLMEQNRQYVADLEEARERSTRQSAILTGLRKSNANLVKTMREQSQEIARLTKAMQDQSREIAHMKTENARLTQTHTSNGPSNNGETQIFNRDADCLETDL